ncbi:MAG TPA: hypothetical protein VGC24_02155 [Burkholderiaceae bacterium]
MTQAITSTELARRFQPVFDRIAEGAATRENQRALAFDAVGWLAACAHRSVGARVA